jgi:nucleoside-diphosphate-sugar epimerase
MRIFVAGATGVLGRRVVPLLVGDGHGVTGVARSSARASLLRSLGATPATLDPFDRDAVEKALAGYDGVCNLATHIPSPGKMLLPNAWSENDRIRTQLSRILVDAARAQGVSRLVQESIAFLYRDGGGAWIDESWPLDPVANLQSAMVAEGNAARFTELGGTAVTLRFAAFYGPDSDTTQVTMRLARWRIALLVGPNAYVSSITTDDAASAVAAALAAPAGTYNVGDDEPLTRRDYFGALSEALGVGAPHFGPAGLARLGGARAGILARSQRVSNRRFTDATGWKPLHPSAREGWRAVVAALPFARGAA